MLQAINENTSSCYIFFAISLSGFLSLQYIDHLYFKVLPIYKKNWASLSKAKMETIAHLFTLPYVTVFGISFLVGILFLVWLPLSLDGLNSYETFLGIVIGALTLLLFLEINLSIATNKITGQLIFLLWLFLFNVIMLIGRVPKLLYSWLKAKEDTKLDVGKLTFVWGVIALMLILVSRK